MSDTSKYRGLSVASTVCKLIINITLERIRPWYEAQLSKEQNGFRKTVVQQMEYIQWREFTKFWNIKNNLYICYLSI